MGTHLLLVPFFILSCPGSGKKGQKKKKKNCSNASVSAPSTALILFIACSFPVGWKETNSKLKCPDAMLASHVTGRVCVHE